MFQIADDPPKGLNRALRTIGAFVNLNAAVQGPNGLSSMEPVTKLVLPQRIVTRAYMPFLARWRAAFRKRRRPEPFALPRKWSLMTSNTLSPWGLERRTEPRPYHCDLAVPPTGLKP
jgi:hypothetical protein